MTLVLMGYALACAAAIGFAAGLMFRDGQHEQERTRQRDQWIAEIVGKR